MGNFEKRGLSAEAIEKQGIAKNFLALLEDQKRFEREAYEKRYGHGTGEMFVLDKQDREYFLELMQDPGVTSRDLNEDEKEVADPVASGSLRWMPFPAFEEGVNNDYDVIFSRNQMAIVPREALNRLIESKDDPRYRGESRPLLYYEFMRNLGISSAYRPVRNIGEGIAAKEASDLYGKLSLSVESLRSES